ncbi:MAG: invasion associated locus B family protein [Alphaproteobacteria bacterium]|nr:invasion associated locus B family protein [Alphaproteobacteria bacterium]
MAATTALSLAATVVLAADPPAKPQQFDKWEVTCDKSATAKAERCIATQVQTLKDGGLRLIQVSIGKLGPQGEPVIVTALPLGIFIPGGATLKIEGMAPIPLTITQCTAVGCMAQTQLSDQTLATMADAKRMVVSVQPVGAVQPLDINLQTEGMKAALAKLK